MRIKRILFLINSLWELARFLALFLALAVTFRPVLLSDPAAVYWLILLASGQLLLPAAMVLLYLDPGRFAALLNLVRLGKFLGILAGLMLVFVSPFRTVLRFAGGFGLPSALVPYTVVIAVLIVDLIFVLLLFLWTAQTPPGDPDGQSADGSWSTGRR
jgi:hypothetical protein